MAPIAVAVRSAILHAAPSRNKRASSAANGPSTVIGITVLVTCFAVAIVAICWLFWWRRRARKAKTGDLCMPELDTTSIRHELKCGSIASEVHEVHELPVTKRSSEASTAGPPGYLESLQRQPRAPYRATTSQSTNATHFESSSTAKCSALHQLLGVNKRIDLERSPLDEAQSANLLVAPATIGNTKKPEILQDPRPRKAYVDPHEVEHNLNPVYYPKSLAGASNRQDGTPSTEALLPDTDVQQPNNSVLSDFDQPTPEMEMQPMTTISDPDELHMRQPTLEDNGIAMDTQQGEFTSPLNGNLTQSHPYEVVQMQIDYPRSAPLESRTTVDVISSDPSNPQALDKIQALAPASPPNLSSRKRVAYHNLRRLEIDNAIGEPSSNPNRTTIDRSKQRRRPKQRTLIPKTSSPHDSKNTPSPQSNKSTPDSASTDLSFASTATQATSPGSSAITTPSIGVESPATLFTPLENQLTCRDCGQAFNTPGQQKKHYNRQHNLRYVCDLCLRPFGVRVDLERHEHTVHADKFRSNRRSWCTVPGCQTPNKEWKRKDNFTRHVRSCEARLAATTMG